MSFHLKTAFNFHVCSSWTEFCAKAKQARIQIKWNKSYGVQMWHYRQCISLHISLKNLYCNRQGLAQTWIPLQVLQPAMCCKTNGCHVHNPGQKAQLGFVLGNGLLDPAKKPSKSFLPAVVLGILVNPPYPSSINKWHTCGEASLERVVWGWTLTRPIILHFHSTEQSKLEEASRNR